MGTRTSVVDIAEDMELVDSKALDDITDGADEIVGTTRRDNRIDDNADVGSLVVVGEALVQQLLDDIGEIVRQRLAHLRSRVFR